jgi:hypothetical protein
MTRWKRPMMFARIRYVIRRVNRLGQERWYWQRRGHKPTRLPDDPLERVAMAEQLNVAADKATPDNESKMARGRKPLPPSEKIKRGTFQPCRDKLTFEITTPQSLPQQPDWLLTKAGAIIWLDLVGRATQVGASELDSTTLALYCNILADIATAAANGFSPPISAYSVAAKYAEMLGLAGVKSRVIKGVDPTKVQKEPNPFDRFKPDYKPPPRK